MRRLREQGIRTALALALALALAPGARAANEAKPLTLKLKPRQHAGLEHGKAVVVKGEAGTVPQWFLLDGITYLMPVAVALRARRRPEGARQCEATYYDEDDWYQRYGWIHHNFMKAKYESAPE